MAALHDIQPTYRVLEASVDVAVGPDAVPSDLRRPVTAQTVEEVLAALGPLPADGKLTVSVDATLSLRLRSLDEPARAVLPVTIALDPSEDHGDGTGNWSPHELLAAVVQNEVDRSWRRFTIDQFISDALSVERGLRELSQSRRISVIAFQEMIGAAELALHRVGLPPGRLLARCRRFPAPCEGR